MVDDYNQSKHREKDNHSKVNDDSDHDDDAVIITISINRGRQTTLSLWTHLSTCTNLA